MQDPSELRTVSLLSLTDASSLELTARARTPSNAGGSRSQGLDDDDEGSADEDGGPNPQALTASPRRHRHPAEHRRWSQHQRQRRPNTPEVLWPIGGKAYRQPPTIKRRKNPRHLDPLPSDSVKYSDEHVGFRTTDQVS